MLARACPRTFRSCTAPTGAYIAPIVGTSRAVHFESGLKVGCTSSTILPAATRTFASEAAPNNATIPTTPTATERRQLEEEYSAAIIHGRSVYEPVYHEKTHGIPAATIHLRSYHIQLLSLFTHFVAHSASALGIPVSKPMPLPIQRSLWTVPKGPFVHKKSQENFDRKTMKRVIKAWDTDPEVVERWVRYLEKHSLAGVGMRVVRWERAPVGVGQKVAESVKAAMDAARLDTSKEKVKALGEQIVKQELSVAEDIEAKAQPEVETPQ